MNDEGGITEEQINQVKRYIEFCLTKYLTQRQTIDCLADQKNIEPEFTRTVWRQLELQNREFFDEYYQRLRVIDYTKRFNRYLERLYQQMLSNGSLSNGSQQIVVRRDNGLPLPSNGSHPHNGIQPRCNGSQQQHPLMNGSQQVLIPNGMQTHRHNGVQPQSNGSRVQNGVGSHSNGSQQLVVAPPRPMHQHNGVQPQSNGSRIQNGVGSHSNGSQQLVVAPPRPMHQHNGVQHRPNGSQQQAVALRNMHHHNGIQHRPNGSQQQAMVHQCNGSGSRQVLMNQHNVNNGSHALHVSNGALARREAMQQQPVLNNREAMQPQQQQALNSQGMNESVQSNGGTLTSTSSGGTLTSASSGGTPTSASNGGTPTSASNGGTPTSASTVLESASLMGDQSEPESSSGGNPEE